MCNNKCNNHSYATTLSLLHSLSVGEMSGVVGLVGGVKEEGMGWDGRKPPLSPSKRENWSGKVGVREARGVS